YWRDASAGSTLCTEHVDDAHALLAGARGLLVGGIVMAVSASARAAAFAAMRAVSAAGGVVTYDPNVRPKLAGAAAARQVLAEAARFAGVVTPSCPADSRLLFDTGIPGEAADRTLELGARAALVTCGTDDAVLAHGESRTRLPVPVNPGAVDATGAGDVLAGTLTARLALGDELPDAARLGIAAASLSVAGLGGTGRIPALADSRELALAHLGGGR
ncbi:MAG: sugar kinase, partial [Actinophytocola sp.]|nr:sugar kinase [Actinophytocola sp.]